MVSIIQTVSTRRVYWACQTAYIFLPGHSTEVGREASAITFTFKFFFPKLWWFGNDVKGFIGGGEENMKFL